MKTSNPHPDIQLVDTDRLVGEIVRRCDHAVVVYFKNGVHKTGEGVDVTVHAGGSAYEGKRGGMASLALLNNATSIILKQMDSEEA